MIRVPARGLEGRFRVAQRMSGRRLPLLLTRGRQIPFGCRSGNHGSGLRDLLVYRIHKHDCPPPCTLQFEFRDLESECGKFARCEWPHLIAR